MRDTPTAVGIVLSARLWLILANLQCLHFLVIKCRETGADVGAVVIDVRCSAAPIARCEVE
jgi:hypothetical protein